MFNKCECGRPKLDDRKTCPTCFLVDNAYLELSSARQDKSKCALDEDNHTVDSLMYAIPNADQINPAHYKSDPSGIECIEITRHRNFNIGNAIKYLWRAGLKDKEAVITDLKKAIWYIEDEIKKLEATNKSI